MSGDSACNLGVLRDAFGAPGPPLPLEGIRMRGCHDASGFLYLTVPLRLTANFPLALSVPSFNGER